jgi:peptidoglycan glycosyltransferase
MGVWLGNDDNRPSGSSSHLAAALWGEIVRSSTASP